MMRALQLSSRRYLATKAARQRRLFRFALFSPCCWLSARPHRLRVPPAILAQRATPSRDHSVSSTSEALLCPAILTLSAAQVSRPMPMIPRRHGTASMKRRGDCRVLAADRTASLFVCVIPQRTSSQSTAVLPTNAKPIGSCSQRPVTQCSYSWILRVIRTSRCLRPTPRAQAPRQRSVSMRRGSVPVFLPQGHSYLLRGLNRAPPRRMSCELPASSRLEPRSQSARPRGWP